MMKIFNNKRMEFSAIIFLSVIFWIIIFKNIPSDFLDIGGDSAQYIILAESISQGKGYRMVNYPQEPFSTHYPPVFPLFLSPIIYFFGRNFYLMHLLVASFGYTGLFFIYKIFKEYSDSKFSFFLILFFSLNWVFLIYSAQYILSDVPYLFFSFFSLFMSLKYIKSKKIFNMEGFFLLLSLLLSYFCRYSGIALFFGLFVTFLVNKEYKKIVFVSGIFISLFLAWNIYGLCNTNPFSFSHLKIFFLIDSYAPHKGTLFEHPHLFVLHFVDAINYYSEIISDTLFLSLHKKWPLLKGFLSLASISLVLLGLWIKFRENKKCVFHYYFLLYFFLITSARAFGEAIRYILPILPLVFFYFYSGLKKLSDFLSKRLFYFIFPSILILNLLILPLKKPTFDNIPYPIKNFLSLHYWIKENLPPRGILLSRKPTISYFFTKHKAVCYPFSIKPDETWQSITKNKIEYVVVDEFSRETYYYLSAFIYKYKDRLELLYRIGDTGLFKIKGD